MRIWIIALGVVTVLALAGGYWYGSWESGEVLVKQSADTASEGIKVHGDWEVTVSDPATGEEMVYAFENALWHEGASLLTALLSAEAEVNGQFIVLIHGSDVENYQESTVWWCETEMMGGFGKSTIYASVTRDPFVVGGPLTYSGSCVVSNVPDGESGQIGFVETQVSISDFIKVIPHHWDGIGDTVKETNTFNLTYHELPEPITVNNGQTVGVNVRISFE